MNSTNDLVFSSARRSAVYMILALSPLRRDIAARMAPHEARLARARRALQHEHAFRASAR